MRLKIPNEAPAAPASLARPQAAARVPPLRQGIQASLPLAGARDVAHGRADVLLQSVREDVPEIVLAESAHEVARAGARTKNQAHSVPMHDLREEVPVLERAAAAHEDAHEY